MYGTTVLQLGTMTNAFLNERKKQLISSRPCTVNKVANELMQRSEQPALIHCITESLFHIGQHSFIVYVIRAVSRAFRSTAKYQRRASCRFILHLFYI